MPELVNLEEFNRVGMKLGVTHNQSNMVHDIRKNIITIAHGPAGTGKTYVAIAEGIRALLSGKEKVDGLIFVRPAVEAEENLGYLPGTADEKIEPYMAPLWMNVRKLLNGKSQDTAKYITPMSMAFLRGITFENCYVILDEAQNTTPTQMKLFLTRIGRHCKVVIVGDTKQSDIGQLTGLSDAISKLGGINGIAVCELTSDDNMRNSIVNKILTAYDGLDTAQAKESFDKFMDTTFPDPVLVDNFEDEVMPDIYGKVVDDVEPKRKKTKKSQSNT